MPPAGLISMPMAAAAMLVLVTLEPTKVRRRRPLLPLTACGPPPPPPPLPLLCGRCGTRLALLMWLPRCAPMRNPTRPLLLLVPALDELGPLVARAVFGAVRGGGATDMEGPGAYGDMEGPWACVLGLGGSPWFATL